MILSYRQCRESVLQNGWQDTKNLEMNMIKKQKSKALRFKVIIRNCKLKKILQLGCKVYIKTGKLIYRMFYKIVDEIPKILKQT